VGFEKIDKPTSKEVGHPNIKIPKKISGFGGATFPVDRLDTGGYV